jgi:hypothetical protein
MSDVPDIRTQHCGQRTTLHWHTEALFVKRTTGALSADI